MKIYNTLSGKVEAFKFRSDDKKVRIYCCGPTVYGYTHVGNARASLTLDLITRIFHFGGYKTSIARNYTDIDDKIIKVAETEKKDSAAVARFYQDAYDAEMKELEAHQPDFRPI